MIHHLQLNLTLKPRMDCWRRDVNPKSESGQRALSLHAGGKTRADVKRHIFSRPRQNKNFGLEQITGRRDFVLVGNTADCRIRIKTFLARVDRCFHASDGWIEDSEIRVERQIDGRGTERNIAVWRGLDFDQPPLDRNLNFPVG